MSSGSTNPFSCIIDVTTYADSDDVDICLVCEMVRPVLLNSDSSPTNESLLRHEVDFSGWDMVLGDDLSKELSTGRYFVKGSIVYDCDYWGEWDMWFELDEFKGANRRGRRALARMEAKTHEQGNDSILPAYIT